mgnify:CR=1 FL=1
MPRYSALFAAVLALAASTPQIQAQTYPSKPIRLILPYPPGGGSDTIARPLVHKVSESSGQQMIVDNRGGANGNVGMEVAARAASDGYTVVMALTAQLAINPALYDKLNRVTGQRHDPCVLDTFIGAVRYVDGAPARPWWHYTRERKRVLAAQAAPAKRSPRNSRNSA